VHPRAGEDPPERHHPRRSSPRRAARAWRRDRRRPGDSSHRCGSAPGLGREGPRPCSATDEMRDRAPYCRAGGEAQTPRQCRACRRRARNVTARSRRGCRAPSSRPLHRGQGTYDRDRPQRTVHRPSPTPARGEGPPVLAPRRSERRHRTVLTKGALRRCDVRPARSRRDHAVAFVRARQQGRPLGRAQASAPRRSSVRCGRTRSSVRSRVHVRDDGARRCRCRGTGTVSRDVGTGRAPAGAFLFRPTVRFRARISSVAEHDPRGLPCQRPEAGTPVRSDESSGRRRSPSPRRTGWRRAPSRSGSASREADHGGRKDGTRPSPGANERTVRAPVHTNAPQKSGARARGCLEP